MCISPVTIKNPLYLQGVSNYKDTVSPYIKVPCGHCYQCLASKSNAINQRVQVESIFNYIYMVTLTLDNKHLPYNDFNGTRLYFAPFDILTKMLKRFRKTDICPNGFKYLFVNDYGSNNNRPHFHGLLFIPKLLPKDDFEPYRIEKQLFNWFKFNWCVNVGTNFHPIYEPMYEYHTKYVGGQLFRSFDLHYVRNYNGDIMSPSFYVSKYLFKQPKFVNYCYNVVYDYFGSPEPDSPRFEEFRNMWNLYRINRHNSLDFGSKSNPDIVFMIKEFGEKSLEFGFEYPMFFDLYTHEPSPMCGFYRKLLPLSLQSKFRQPEFDTNGCITYKYVQRHFHDKQVNLFDFIDFL